MIDAERIEQLQRRFAERGRAWLIEPASVQMQSKLAALGFGKSDAGGLEGFYITTETGGQIADGRNFPTLDDVEAFVVFLEDGQRFTDKDSNQVP